jgi:hypothetical protein
MEGSVYGENIPDGLLDCIIDGFLKGYLRRSIISFAQRLLARIPLFPSHTFPSPLIRLSRIGKGLNLDSAGDMSCSIPRDSGFILFSLVAFSTPHASSCCFTPSRGGAYLSAVFPKIKLFKKEKDKKKKGRKPINHTSK